MCSALTLNLITTSLLIRQPPDDLAHMAHWPTLNSHRHILWLTQMYHVNVAQVVDMIGQKAESLSTRGQLRIMEFVRKYMVIISLSHLLPIEYAAVYLFQRGTIIV